MTDKPKGWFSRRHPTREEHDTAVAHYANRPARRVAERAEREVYDTQRCSHEGCTLVRRGHVWLADKPTNRRYPDHEFVGPDTICGLGGCSVARQDHGIIADHPFIEPGQDPAILAANDPNRFTYLDELGRRTLR